MSADDGVILIVDDDEMARHVLQGFIAGIGHRAIAARHGGQAIDIIEDMGPSIRMMITDICMPVMDGIELIRHVRERLPELPIAVVTGYADDARLRSVRSEIMMLFQKPLRYAELAALLGPPAAD